MGKSLYFESIKKEAEKYFEKACEKNQNIEDIIEIATFYKNNEEYEKAEKYFEKGIYLENKNDYEKMGNLYFQKGDYKRALEILEKVENKDELIKSRMAAIYMELEDYEKAEKLYMEAMYETEMGFSPVFIGLGKICEKQKKYEEAEKNYLKGIKLASLGSIVNLYDLYKERGLENDLQYEIEKLLKLIANNVEKLLFFEEDCTEKLQKMFHNEKNYIMMIIKMKREIKKYIKNRKLKKNIIE